MSCFDETGLRGVRGIRLRPVFSWHFCFRPAGPRAMLRPFSHPLTFSLP